MNVFTNELTSYKIHALSTLAWNCSNLEAKPLTNDSLAKLDQLRINNAGISKDNDVGLPWWRSG